MLFETKCNKIENTVGDSPSGKAVGSGPTIRGFESLIPSQEEIKNASRGGFCCNMGVCYTITMSVYDLDLKGMRNTLIEFHQSIYGRTIFFLAYFIPFVLFIVGVLASLLAMFFSFDAALFNISMFSILAFFPAFILANMYFYNEIRRFCAHKERKTRRAQKNK